MEKVNMYDIHENLITYSFQPEMIGQKEMGGSGYLTALKGETTSKLIQRGGFWRMALGFPRDSLMITYAPIVAEKRYVVKTGTVMGVMEIEIDVSDDYYTIFRSQILIVVIITLVMSLLSIILIFVVKRGEGIIEKRALERARLKEELNRAKHLSSLGELTAAISHEIRNPLGIIRSSAELLQKKLSRDNPQNTIPQVIVEEANRLNSIITDFLNYARPRQPQRNPCQVEEIIDKNLSYLAPQIEAGQHQLRKYYSTPLPTIEADRDMLYQVFLNLFLNAMQAMVKPGEIQIEAFAGKRTITIVIEDEGTGISEEVGEQMWNPFFTTKSTGTGLGLGIVKNIIDAHGGKIRIESKKPLKGARVTIELPISEA
ncbi:MAG: ATP-binding protein [Desulfobacterales bacterium]